MQAREILNSFGFILIPIMALSIDLGRYFYARAEGAMPTDAAALAAVAEISQRGVREDWKFTAHQQNLGQRPGVREHE